MIFKISKYLILKISLLISLPQRESTIQLLSREGHITSKQHNVVDSFESMTIQ